MVSEAVALLLNEKLHHPLARSARNLVPTPYIIAVNRYFPEARLICVSGQSWTHETVETARDERRMAKNSMDREARWQVRSGVERIHFFLYTGSRVAGDNTTTLPASTSTWYYVGFMGHDAFSLS